jgi:hypothetical protein
LFLQNQAGKDIWKASADGNFTVLTGLLNGAKKEDLDHEEQVCDMCFACCVWLAQQLIAVVLKRLGLR